MVRQVRNRPEQSGRVDGPEAAGVRGPRHDARSTKIIGRANTPGPQGPPFAAAGLGVWSV